MTLNHDREKRITIYHIISGLETGGAEHTLYSILKGGLISRYDNCVISLGDKGSLGGKIGELGVPVYALNMRSQVSLLAGAARLRRMMRQRRPHVIQGWMYHGNLAAWWARLFVDGKPPAVAWNIRHCMYQLKDEKVFTRAVIRAGRWLSGSVAAIVYNSSLSRKQHERFGFNVESGRVIANGFDLAQFRASADSRALMRKDLGIPFDAMVIGHVARFHPLKGHALLLRAASRLCADHSDVHFLLIGRGVDWKNESIAALVPPLYRDRVHLLGERSDVGTLLCGMDVLCQSSRSEAFPNVLGEAMATEVPCVATDVGDTNEIVGEAGVVVPPGDLQALVEGLQSVIAMCPEERSSLGVAARQRIATRYPLDMACEQYAALYAELLHGQ